MKTTKRIAAVLLSLVILIPSVMLWCNLSFIKTSAYSVITALLSGQQRLDKSLSVSASEIDKAASDYVGFHFSFINLYGLGMKLCGSRMVNIGNRIVVRLDSGSLVEYNPDETQFEANMQTAKKNAAALAAFKGSLEEKNIPLLFVLVPGKVDKYDPGLPYQLEDHSNPIADAFLRCLDESGVDYIDLREVWHEKGWSYAEGFYNSDLHWRPTFALRSWGYVTQYLNDCYGIYNDPATFDLDHQKVELFYDASLGDTGRIVGKYYAQMDGTELYIPDFETHFHLVNERVGWDKTGTFEETTVNRDALTEGTLFTTNLTELYYARDSVVENTLAQNDANVVFIRDSFGGALGGYVPLAFKNTSMVDMRTMKARKEESVQSIIDDFDTDLVIVFYNVGMTDAENMFAF